MSLHGEQISVVTMSKVGVEQSQLMQIIQVLEAPSKHHLKYLSNRAQLGRILLSRSSGNDDKEAEKEQKREMDKMFKAFSDYLTTLMVVAALVLTISIPWLFTSINKTAVYDDFFDDDTLRYLNNVMVVLMMCSSMFSTLTLVVAIVFHVNINLVLITTEDKLWFVSEHYVGICEELLVVSSLFLIFSLPFGIFVSYGNIVAYICIAIFVFTMLFIAVFALRLLASLRRHLFPKYQQIALEFRAALDALAKSDSTATAESHLPAQ